MTTKRRSKCGCCGESVTAGYALCSTCQHAADSMRAFEDAAVAAYRAGWTVESIASHADVAVAVERMSSAR